MRVSAVDLRFIGISLLCCFEFGRIVLPVQFAESNSKMAFSSFRRGTANESHVLFSGLSKQPT